jgi:AI-2 transport protein TqsA
MQPPSIFKPIIILTGAAILLLMMHFAAPILMPILMAAFFATLLSPIYTLLKKWRLPGGLALLLSAALLAVIALFVGVLVGNSFATLAVSLKNYSDLFSQRQAELTALADKLGQGNSLKGLISALDPATLVGVLTYILGALAGLAKVSVIILVITIFILSEAPQFVERMYKTFGENHFLPKNMTALAGMMISYFGLRAVVNLVTASVTGLALWLLGIDNAGLWAVLLFFLSFVPYIGAFIAMIPPVLLAYAQSGLGLAAVVIVLSVVINGITENIVAPLVMGKGLSISPTVVFISYIFWMFILGGAGAFIAMPLTLALILFMSNFEETRNFAALMLSTPPVTKTLPEAKKGE